MIVGTSCTICRTGAEKPSKGQARQAELISARQRGRILRPLLSATQTRWADLGGAHIYNLSFYIFEAGTKNVKYPRAGLILGLRG